MSEFFKTVNYNYEVNFGETKEKTIQLVISVLESFVSIVVFFVRMFDGYKKKEYHFVKEVKYWYSLFIPGVKSFFILPIYIIIFLIGYIRIFFKTLFVYHKIK